MPMSIPAFTAWIQKRGVHRFANTIIASERKLDVADATAESLHRADLLDSTNRFNEVDGVIVVLLDSRGHGQDVRIEDNVLGGESRPVRSAVVGPLANSNFVVHLGCLPLFVKGHHDDCRPVAADQPGAGEKFLLRHL